MKLGWVSLALAAGTLLTSCDHEVEATAQAAAQAGPTLRTAAVEEVSWQPTVEVTGSLEPVASVQLGFDVPGRIKDLLVQRGASVSAGEAVARLDSTLATGQLQQAEAALAAATAQADTAESSWARIEKLGDAVSPQQRAEVEAAQKGAAAMRDQARAAVSVAKTAVGYHTLRAPIGGVVTAGPDNPGILVGAGTPLFFIEDLSALRMKTTLSEGDGWVSEGMAVRVISGIGGEATSGVVERVIPALDPVTRRIPVEIRIDSPPQGFRAHAFVRATIHGEQNATAFSIPRAALVASPEFAVFVLDSGGPVRVPVTVLDEQSDHIVVRGALRADAQVVLNPPHGYGE